MGIEPTQPAWKAGILAIELHPHMLLFYILSLASATDMIYYNRYILVSQYYFFKK